MKRADWENSRAKLQALYDIYDVLPNQPSELKAHWIRYLIVRTAGFLETSVSDFYSSYAEGKSSPRIQRFVEKRLEYPGNMNMDRFVKLANEFGEDWRTELEKDADFDRTKAAVNSLISIRNAIAHGDTVTTSIGQLRDYQERSMSLLEKIFVQCDRESNTHRMTRREKRAMSGQ